MSTTTTTYDVTTAAGRVPVTVTDQGAGHPFLLLHGGAGPASVAGFAGLLASTCPARVITPVHPGFGGTPRAEGTTTVADLAALYVALLDELELADVTVVGNSLGGWTAAEIALLRSPRISSVVLVDAVGLTSDTEPIVDFFGLDMDEVIELSYHPSHREAARAAQRALPAPALAAMPGNRAALLGYGGVAMADPTLQSRLSGVSAPVLVVWGAADRIVRPSHARAYAAAIPGAALAIIDDAGHLPQLETPDRLAALVWDFADAHADSRPDEPVTPQ